MYFVCKEEAFLSFDAKPRGAEALQNTMEIVGVAFPCRREDDDVIQIYKAELPFVSSEYQIHHTLKRGGSVGKTHRHNVPFVETSVRGEGTLRSARFVQRYLPVAGGEIHGGEPFCSAQSIKGIVGAREWILVTGGHGI